MATGYTLKQLIYDLSQTALEIPDIRTVVKNDITRLNEMREVEYGVFGITQNEHTFNPRTGELTYSLNLFYIDRLTNSEDNELEIQSHGIEVLKSVLKFGQQNGGVQVGDARIAVLTQRFQDLCAGAWASVNFTINEGYCEEL